MQELGSSLHERRGLNKFKKAANALNHGHHRHTRSGANTIVALFTKDLKHATDDHKKETITYKMCHLVPVISEVSVACSQRHHTPSFFFFLFNFSLLSLSLSLSPALSLF